MGLGAVLAQKQADNRIHPIAYASRSLNPHEKNYGISKLETLGLVWAGHMHRCSLHYTYLSTIMHKSLNHQHHPEQLKLHVYLYYCKPICIGYIPKCRSLCYLHKQGPKARGYVNRIETESRYITDLYHGPCGHNNASSS